MNKLFSEKGFTLIELLVVIAIIGVLSSITYALLSDSRVRAQDALRLRHMKEVQKALELYYAEHNQYPPTDGPSASGASGIWTKTRCLTNPTAGWCELRTMLAPYIDLPFPPNQNDFNAVTVFEGETFYHVIAYYYRSRPDDNYQTYGFATPLYSPSNYSLMANDGGVYNSIQSGTPGNLWLPMFEVGPLPAYCATKYTNDDRDWWGNTDNLCVGGN